MIGRRDGDWARNCGADEEESESKDGGDDTHFLDVGGSVRLYDTFSCTRG